MKKGSRYTPALSLERINDLLQRLAHGQRVGTGDGMSADEMVVLLTLRVRAVALVDQWRGEADNRKADQLAAVLTP